MAVLRLFTALTISDELKTAVSALPPQKFDARWTHPADLHITIRYLGPVSETRIPLIRDALSGVRRPPFFLEVSGLGFFANRQQTILYATIESTRKLTTLCAEITDRLTPLGFDFGTRPFTPHITLARCKQVRPVQDFIYAHGRKMRARWLAEDFHLMESGQVDEAGRHYNTIAHYPLAG